MNFVAVAIVSAIVFGHPFKKRVVFDCFKLHSPLFKQQQPDRHFGFDHFNLSSANISLHWHIIQCTRTVKINTMRFGKILTVEINLSVLKLMFLGQFVLYLRKRGLKMKFRELFVEIKRKFDN